MLRSSILISSDAPDNTYRHETSLIAGSRPAAAELRRIQLDYRLGIGVHVSSDIPSSQPDLLMDLPRVPKVQGVRCTICFILRSKPLPTQPKEIFKDLSAIVQITMRSLLH